MRSFEVIRLVSNLSCLVPLAVYAMRLTKVDKPIHVIAGLMLVSGLSDLITFIKPDWLNVMLVFNIQDILQFSLITLFYYLIDPDRKFISWGVTLYLTFLIAVTAWSQGIFEYQTLMWTISGLIVITYAIMYLINLYQSDIKKKETFGLLWISSGFLFYFCLSLALFVVADYILNELDDKLKMVYWSCHNVNNIFKCVLIAIGIGHSAR